MDSFIDESLIETDKKVNENNNSESKINLITLIKSPYIFDDIFSLVPENKKLS